MAFAPSERLNAAIDQGRLTDISELWQEAGLAEFYPANLRALSTHNGKQYIYPLGYTWNAIYYNKQVFAQYNLQPPTTWDELFTLCDTLLINGETPFALSGRDPFMAMLWVDYLNLRLNGPAFHRQTSGGELPYTDAQFAALFATWRSLVERGYFVPNAATLNDMATLTALARNEKLQISDAKAVMALTGPAFLNELPAVFRDELDFFPFPTIDPSIPSGEVVFAIGYLAPSAAAHRSEALLFLKYLASPEARTLLNQDADSVSLFVPAFASADNDHLPLAVKQGMALVQEADEILTPVALDLPSSTQFALAGLLRQLLADPQNGKPFNLEAALEQLEAARQKE
jgi:ABC-type glycerol-3-phosphate transport system substrate-binding protein